MAPALTQWCQLSVAPALTQWVPALTQWHQRSVEPALTQWRQHSLSGTSAHSVLPALSGANILAPFLVPHKRTRCLRVCEQAIEMVGTVFEVFLLLDFIPLGNRGQIMVSKELE